MTKKTTTQKRLRFPDTLYTAQTLYDGYHLGQPDTLAQCFDTRVYKYYLSQGKLPKDVRVTMSRAMHDHKITSALQEFLQQYKPWDVVGVMGGHGVSRASRQFSIVAHMAKRLTEHGKLMVSGGGPGAMEATHLGAWMAGRGEDELRTALGILSEAPDFHDPLWLDCAMRVRRRFPQERYESVGIPTWLYGHEPATPLATRIAKYFDNSIREDGILTYAMGGIVFTPGSAGTLQEIFQEAVQNHYLSFGFASPMAFLDRRYWTEEVPVYPLIEDMLRRGKYRNLILSIGDTAEEMCREILSFTPPPRYSSVSGV